MIPLNALQQQTTNMVTKHIFAELSLIKRGHKRLFHPNSGFRMRTGEKIGKISTSFILWYHRTKIFKTYLFSNLSQLPHLRLAGLLICHGKSYQNLSHKSITQIKQLLSQFHSLLRHTYKLTRLTTFLSQGSLVHSLRCYHTQKTDIESPIEILQG